MMLDAALYSHDATTDVVVEGSRGVSVGIAANDGEVGTQRRSAGAEIRQALAD
jgi:hypothetical protein